MYDYIKGKVVEVKVNGIVLECFGIGYFIYTANPYLFKEKEEYKVYLYQVVKEEELSFFGFSNVEEKEMFLKLIHVKGLGPRMALPILATGSISGIVDAIQRENLVYLKKFPKIGDKLARQIVLDLKGKLGDISVTGSEDSNTNDELHEALLSLGYKEKEVKKVIPQIPVDMKVEDQIKEALKLLLK